LEENINNPSVELHRSYVTKQKLKHFDGNDKTVSLTPIVTLNKN